MPTTWQQNATVCSRCNVLLFMGAKVLVSLCIPWTEESKTSADHWLSAKHLFGLVKLGSFKAVITERYMQGNKEPVELGDHILFWMAVLNNEIPSLHQVLLVPIISLWPSEEHRLNLCISFQTDAFKSASNQLQDSNYIYIKQIIHVKILNNLWSQLIWISTETGLTMFIVGILILPSLSPKNPKPLWAP